MISAIDNPELRARLDAELVRLLRRAHAQGELAAAFHHYRRGEFELVSERMNALEELVNVHLGDPHAAFLTRLLAYELLAREAVRRESIFGERHRIGGER